MMHHLKPFQWLTNGSHGNRPGPTARGCPSQKKLEDWLSEERKLTPTLTFHPLTSNTDPDPDPNRHQNLIVCSLGHAPHLQKSVYNFLQLNSTQLYYQTGSRPKRQRNRQMTEKWRENHMYRSLRHFTSTVERQKRSELTKALKPFQWLTNGSHGKGRVQQPEDAREGVE